MTTQLSSKYQYEHCTTDIQLLSCPEQEKKKKLSTAFGDGVHSNPWLFFEMATVITHNNCFLILSQTQGSIVLNSSLGLLTSLCVSPLIIKAPWVVPLGDNLNALSISLSGINLESIRMQAHPHAQIPNYETSVPNGSSLGQQKEMGGL